MKKNRSMIAAVALLAVMCAGYGAVSFGVAQSEKHRQEEEAADTIYLTDFEEVTGISVASQEQTMNFEKKEGEWLDADDPERPLKQSLVALLASSGQKLTAVRKLEGAGELSNYGLDDPAYRAVFSDDNGKEAAILVGDAAFMRSWKIRRMSILLTADWSAPWIIQTWNLPSRKSCRR